MTLLFTGISPSQLRVIFNIIYPANVLRPMGKDEESLDTYIKLALSNMLTTLEISWSLSVGTLSQRLKASMSFVRISLLGEEVMYVKGSRIAWVVRVFGVNSKGTVLTCSCLSDHAAFVDNISFNMLS